MGPPEERMRVERTVDIPFQPFQNEVILPHPAGIRPAGRRREIVDDRIPDSEVVKIYLDPLFDFVSQIPAVCLQWEYDITFGKQIDIPLYGSIVGSDHSRKFIETHFRAQLQGDGGNQFFHHRNVSNGLAYLSTYMGHVCIAPTYYYLKFIPELKGAIRTVR